MAEESKGKIEKFNVDDNSKVWYVDSGASIRCTPHRNYFYDYVHGDYEHVTVGNGYPCSIVGKGKMKIRLSNGGTLVLKDVRHIPELQKNLIFVNGLDREGYFVAFGEKQWKKWQALVENETGNKIKCLKSDNGGEYRDGGFQEYYSNNSIRLIRTVKRTPQENGLAERMSKPSWNEQGDYEHNKIIRSRDVIFDESRLYKHREQEHGIEKENKEYIELDELEDGQVPRIENPEVLDETTDTEIGAGDQQQVPETLNLRTKDGQLNLEKIKGNKNPVDMLTKSQHKWQRQVRVPERLRLERFKYFKYAKYTKRQKLRAAPSNLWSKTDDGVSSGIYQQTPFAESFLEYSEHHVIISICNHEFVIRDGETLSCYG
ncbi:hypothetical protein RJ639_037592 [Escallonia herrerae]|uniref:Retrovirus-related Pol polyprotein from transposon TNT 1-94-like beta-barrel domain-containing protein n=1 Tax=Escallonia herrerae TaxID=1293975 RepID=A0AA89B6G7_9ASTE|nr:hypothetical protein RJ639_037592 [Escallonia herrerae]